MTEHIIANRLTENAATENPLESLSDALAFSSDDWAESRAMAWVWGIVHGWDDADDPECDAMDEVSARFRWDPDAVARLRRLHAEFQRIAEEAGRG